MSELFEIDKIFRRILRVLVVGKRVVANDRVKRGKMLGICLTLWA